MLTKVLRSVEGCARPGYGRGRRPRQKDIRVLLWSGSPAPRSAEHHQQGIASETETTLQTHLSGRRLDPSPCTCNVCHYGGTEWKSSAAAVLHHPGLKKKKRVGGRKEEDKGARGPTKWHFETNPAARNEAGTRCGRDSPQPRLFCEANLTMNHTNGSRRRQYKTQILFFFFLFWRSLSVKQDVLNKAWHLGRIIVNLVCSLRESRGWCGTIPLAVLLQLRALRLSFITSCNTTQEQEQWISTHPPNTRTHTHAHIICLSPAHSLTLSSSFQTFLFIMKL